jgi:hypothetical protein
MPELFQKLASTRPEPPKSPAEFQPWPFHTWQVEVLRRAEHVIECVDHGPTFGKNPNAQVLGKPGQVPPEASASCDVAVALLFAATPNKRFMIGVGFRIASWSQRMAARSKTTSLRVNAFPQRITLPDCPCPFSEGERRLLFDCSILIGNDHKGEGFRRRRRDKPFNKSDVRDSNRRARKPTFIQVVFAAKVSGTFCRKPLGKG